MSAILASKPAQISFASAPYTHRRHPSAPVVHVVQPTRTPGLLNIKPQQKQQSANRALPSNQRPQIVKSHAGAKGKVQPTVARAQFTLTPAPEITDKKHAAALMPTTPTPQSRGRSHAKNSKDKAHTQRSASNSSIRGKHGRQPSPPIALSNQPQHSNSNLNQPPSQAEVSIISTTNIFDPFLDSISTSLVSSPPPSPTLARPSGKLARRRQAPSADFSLNANAYNNSLIVSPTPAKAKPQAIPVPGVKRLNYNTLSRSDPVPSHMQQSRPVPKRSATLQDFPICDDLADDFSAPSVSPPATPSRPVHTRASGLRTAPIANRTPFSFPFAGDNSTPSRPSASTGRRNHRRVPSEGVFNMSSDEDVSSGPGGVIFNPNMNVNRNANFYGLMNVAKRPEALFATPSQPRVLQARSRDASPSAFGGSERKAGEGGKTGYFASSMFQNSPSPEELPDPLLL